jgi:Holliday junction resolvase
VAKTPEKRVKDVVTKQLKELGAYYFYPFSMGYGNSGVPDIICCYRGKFIAIECKAGDNEPTALQKKHLMQINEQGGIALIVNEQNMHGVAALLQVGIGEQ